jgi:hypothetical protein
LQSYKIVDCWLLYETDNEGNGNGNLRKVVFSQQEANDEKNLNIWTSVTEAKAIGVPTSNDYHYFVLRYESETRKLGNEVKESIRKAALAKLTEDEKKALGL